MLTQPGKQPFSWVGWKMNRNSNHINTKMNKHMKRLFPRFRLGQCYATKAASDYLKECGVKPQSLLARHTRGDWGDVTEEDARLNEDALNNPEPSRLMSVYNINGRAVFVYTNQEMGRTGVVLSGEEPCR